MRLRNVKNAKEKLENSSYYIKNPMDYKGKWAKEKPIHLEIGTGKGSFLIGMAASYPDLFFIGIEKYESVLVRAIEKVEKVELDNIKFICWDAKEIESIFSNEIDTIYLNFSDPWPKARHAKRRLTSEEFLKKYDSIFKSTKHIIQKTDNIGLFAYSLEQYSKHGYTIEKVSLDLAKENIFNIKTEYEEKFSHLGYKINYVEVIKEKKER